MDTLLISWVQDGHAFDILGGKWVTLLEMVRSLGFEPGSSVWESNTLPTKLPRPESNAPQTTDINYMYYYLFNPNHLNYPNFMKLI